MARQETQRTGPPACSTIPPWPGGCPRSCWGSPSGCQARW